MDDTMASRNGNNQIPIPTNNDNRQFQHAIMATVTPAADGKYPQTNQQSILRYYPNSVPVSALGNGHSGRIRMFAPQRYLAPSGTYYNPESPDVQFPEGVGGNTRGKVNRCRTCHKLLSDHRQPQYNRGGFTCPDACALAAGCLSHPQHPNAPCPQLYMKTRAAQRHLGFRPSESWPMTMQVFPSEAEWLILQANGYVRPDTAYDTAWEPDFTEKAMSLDDRGPAQSSAPGTYKYTVSEAESVKIQATNWAHQQAIQARNQEAETSGHSQSRAGTPAPRPAAPHHAGHYHHSTTPGPMGYPNYYQPPPPSPYMQHPASPYYPPPYYPYYPPPASPYYPPLASPYHPPPPSLYQPAQPAPQAPPTPQVQPAQPASQAPPPQQQPAAPQAPSISILASLPAEVREYFLTGSLPDTVTNDSEILGALRRKDVTARSRHAVTIAEHAINNAVRASEMSRELANVIREQYGLSPMHIQDVPLQGMAKRTRETHQDDIADQEQPPSKKPNRMSTRDSQAAILMAQDFSHDPNQDNRAAILMAQDFSREANNSGDEPG